MLCLLIALLIALMKKVISCHEQCLFIPAMIVITIILLGIKLSAQHPTVIDKRCKHPLQSKKGFIQLTKNDKSFAG
ncbi:hypothetical protein DMI62_20305 [Escherichia coli]|nr:hypothetical protein [Escherichia coli]